MRNPISWPHVRAVGRLATDPAFSARLEEIDAGFDAFVAATCELAQIPAPTLGEAPRAEFVANRMMAIGLSDVEVDAADNAVGSLDGEEPGVVIAAHLDTVFAADEEHSVQCENGRLVGRGIGDNTIGLTAMLEVAALLRRQGGNARTVWFAATSGEEGLGDLRGVRSVIDRLGGRVACFVAVEGHFLGRICTVGVGSRRWRVSLHGSGGHSWHDYGSPSAVHAVADLANRIAKLKMPRRPRTALNVGRIAGGEGVNVIGRKAWLEIDLRSEDQDKLDEWASKIESLCREVATVHNVQIDISGIGDRPAARLPRGHPVVKAAAASLRAVGIQPAYDRASTDANYPGSRGIPSICVGVTRGEGMHTPQEWVEEAPARDGLRQLALLTAALAGVSA